MNTTVALEGENIEQDFQIQSSSKHKSIKTKEMSGGKKWFKQFQNFKHQLVYSCQFSEQVYAFLILTDLILMAIIPCQKLFSIKSQQKLEEEEQFSSYHQVGYIQQLSIYKQLEQLPTFLIITDVFNGISLGLIILLLTAFFYVQKIQNNKIKVNNFRENTNEDQQNHDTSYYQRKNNTKDVLNYVSKILIIFGRFIQNFILGIQISAVKCYKTQEDQKCDQSTDEIRLVTNSVGISITLLLMFFEYKLTQTIFPDRHMPWSRLASRYELLNRFLILYNVFSQVFASLLLDRFRLYLILLAPALISLFQVWNSVKEIRYFSNWVDNSHFIKDIILCNIYIYTISIDLITYDTQRDSKGNVIGQHSLSNGSFIALVLISIAATVILVMLKKRKLMDQEFFIESYEVQNSMQNFEEKYKKSKVKQHSTEHPEPWKIYILLKLIDQNNLNQIIDQGVQNELQLQQMYDQHTSFCHNDKCLCQTEKFSTESVTLNINRSVLEGYHISEEKISELKDENDQLTTYNYDQSQKLKRNETLMKLLIQDLKGHQQCSKQVRFLEIFIKHKYFNRLYSSYYKLLKFKLNNKIKNSYDKLNIFYLKTKILESIRQEEQKLKKEITNVDRLIQVDNSFMEYKRLLYETTMLVERFWSTLSKVEYNISDVIATGQRIVDQYLLTKILYEDMIDLDPQFKDVVMLQMNFNLNVMNFEMEGLNLQNLLKNIQQKILITKQSAYMKQLDKQGLILISGNPQTKSKIILVNQLVCNKLQMTKSQLIGQTINSFMPKQIGLVHDILIEKFLTSNHFRHLTSALERVWLKKRNQCLIPCKIDIQTCVTETHGIVLVGLIDFEQDIHIMNAACKVDEAYFIITDDTGYIQNVSDNFMKRFMQTDQFAIDDSKINTDDIIILKEDIQDIDHPRKGLKAVIIEKFNNVNFHTQGNYNQQNILLTINKFKLPGQNEFKEYAFVECDGNDNKEITILTSHKKMMLENMESGEFGDNQYLDEDYYYGYNNNLSSESGSSRSIELMNLKGAIDFKQTPKTLSNLKRAILIFFCILIGTSFSVLAVTQIQNEQFQEDSRIVKSSIKLGGILANLRLVFRTFLLYPRDVMVGNNFEYEYLQQQIEFYFNQLRENYYITLDEAKFDDKELIQEMSGNSIALQELQSDGTITITYKKFTIALQQVMAKIQKFITIQKDQYTTEFKNWLVVTPGSQPTANQRDAWFIVINGMYDIRSFSLKLYQLFVKQSQNKEDVHDQTVLIITMSCIAVTFLSSICLIPVTFALDSEQEGIVRQWLKVSKQAKTEILQRIEEFSKQLIIDNKQKLLGKRKRTQSSFYQQNFISIMEQVSQVESEKNDRISDFGSMYGANLFMNLASEQYNRSDQSIIDVSSIGLVASKMPNLNGNQEKNNFNRRFMNSEQRVHERNLNNLNEQSKSDSLNKHINQTTTQTEQKQQQESLQEAHNNEELEKYQRIQQKQQLVKIYRSYKVKKILLIMTFSTIIFGFYIAFYFISAQVFQSAKNSFTFLSNINRRTPCLSNVYQFLMETFVQNKTITIGYVNETVMNHAQNTCMVYENRLQEYQTYSPPELALINQFIVDINSNKMCELTFEHNPQEQYECENFQNGKLKKGMANSISNLLYYLFQELIEFNYYDNFQQKRNQEFLNQHIYNSDTLGNMKLLLKYILPSAELLNEKVDYSLKKYMESRISIFIIVFSLFLVFLVLSLYLAMGRLINYLQKDVIRSRVLVKIIPASELQEIHRKQRRKENKKKKYKYQEKYQQDKQ